MQIKNILAATDLSPQAEQAVARAASLAVTHGARLHLLHVVPAVSWKMFGKILTEHPLVTEQHLFDAAAARLEALAKTYRARYAITIQTCAQIGRPHEEIANYARSHAIDLTVLGAHAENFVRDLFVGTTTSRFLRTGTHPIMIARGAQQADYRKILVPVDFSNISRVALHTALDFAPTATICVLHVYEVFFEGKMHYAGVDPGVVLQYQQAAHEEATRHMEEFLADFPHHDACVSAVRHGYAARVILDEAASMQADLLVMGKRGHTELDKLLLGSVTENVLFDLERDLLLVGEG